MILNNGLYTWVVYYVNLRRWLISSPIAVQNDLAKSGFEQGYKPHSPGRSVAVTNLGIRGEK